MKGIFADILQIFDLYSQDVIFEIDNLSCIGEAQNLQLIKGKEKQSNQEEKLCYSL